MKKLYWIFVALLFTVGISVSVYYGLRPKPVPKIKFSLFVTPEEMGQATTQRLRLEILNQEVLFLGLDPNLQSHVALVNGFLQSIKGSPLEYKSLVLEGQLPYKNELAEMFKKNVTANSESERKAGLVEEMDLKSELPRLVQGLQQKPSGYRILVIAPTIYVSHLLPMNLMDRLKTEHKLSYVSIVWADFPTSKEQEPSISPACVVADADREGAGALGCLIQSRARLNYRKNKKEGKYSGLLEQVGELEYLGLFTKEPFK
jgi:hypothetical protein